MADFEKVRTDHERAAGVRNCLPVRQLACALAGDMTTARANHARAWGRCP